MISQCANLRTDENYMPSVNVELIPTTEIRKKGRYMKPSPKSNKSVLKTWIFINNSSLFVSFVDCFVGLFGFRVFFRGELGAVGCSDIIDDSFSDMSGDFFPSFQ
jgi:hypothetical protein